MSNDPIKPSVALLAKIGSIVSHAEELLSPDAHQFDRIALDELLRDPDVREWVEAMHGMALISLPRNKQP